MSSTSQWNFAKAESQTSVGEVSQPAAVIPKQAYQEAAWETPLQKASFQETPTHFSHMHPHRFRSVDMFHIFIYF